VLELLFHFLVVGSRILEVKLYRAELSHAEPKFCRFFACRGARHVGVVVCAHVVEEAVGVFSSLRLFEFSLIILAYTWVRGDVL